jgi:hypothetical protein
VLESETLETYWRACSWRWQEEINMLAQDDEDLQQRAIEKADVPVQGDEDRALEASNSQIDNEWFYSPNFTAFTEENVLQYIAEQDKIRMMSGRYGTCTEWDFILEGGKVKKGSQSGSGERCPLRLGMHSPSQSRLV